MGAPSSAIVAEIYLQHIESDNIYDILQKHKITGYFRYADDILLIYSEDITNINLTLRVQWYSSKVNIYYGKRKKNNKINFLDITIQRLEKELTYGIYRKATATDTIIHNKSCHPPQYKMTAINYMINRLNTYPANKDEKYAEWVMIKHILLQN
jgi:hypothetical protein